MSEKNYEEKVQDAFRSVRFITIEGKQYITMKQLALLLGKSINTVQQMASRGRYTVYGELETVAYKDIFDMNLVPVDTLFSYPIIRDKGLPTVAEGKVRAKCFSKKGDIVTKWFPVHIPQKFVATGDMSPSEGEE